MKKLLYMAVLASLTLTGCMNENEEYLEVQKANSRISFAAPVMKGISRAGYTPVPGEIETTYPATEQFKVFGKRYKGTEPYPGWGTALAEYAAEGEAAVYESTKLYAWDTALSHFWIDGYKYTFGAVSPSTVQNVTYNEKGVQIASFTPAAIGLQYDLMYAPRVYDKTSENMQTGKTGKDGYNGVNIVFKHALSSIVFKIGVHHNNVLVNDKKIPDGIFKIRSIKISGVDGTAKFNQNILTDAPATYDEDPQWTENTGTEASYVILDKGTTGCNIPAIETAKNVKDAMTDVTDAAIGGNNAILIPQTFAAGAKIEIVWTSNGNDTADNIIWNTSYIDLKKESGSWLYGKRYIYNLAFSRNRIFFAPSVQDWEDAAQTDNEITK